MSKGNPESHAEAVDDIDQLLHVTQRVAYEDFRGKIVQDAHGTSWGSDDNHTGDIDYIAVVANAEALALWSIQAAVSGVIGNVIYDRARSAMAAMARRMRGEGGRRIKDVEAHDIAVFALALAGVAVYPTEPVRFRSADFNNTASEVSRVQGRVLVRFTESEPLYDFADGPRGRRVRVTWNRHRCTEVLLPERGASMGNIQWRTYTRHDLRPFAAEDAQAEAIIQEHWPAILAAQDGEAPGAWQSVPVPDA
ncbi:hypothetical protein [Streptomyces sp. Ncost-T10-10d]|uniref:hypothetical protein n=1 Tax=Streptomyces sp. Ncost-T10-10d TaxID=1839774 RepID=UPI00081D519C|nr:hypothetical protein [Streptomyces sp. Ncost-T10-10d]SCF71791.1 hypothetical protein GA0115254_112662 [Streptomyces sp. Ncost-T10-10d]